MNPPENHFKTDHSELIYPMSGTLIGTGVSTTIGNMGLVGSFGGVAINTIPMTMAGSMVGFAAYGAKEAIENSDSTVIFPLATGAVMGAGFSSMIGGIGVSAAGTAIGIGPTTLTVAGGITGLGVYGALKLLDKMGNGETATQAFTRIEEQVLEIECYAAALAEVNELINPDWVLESKFKALEIEEELQKVKAEIKTIPQPQNINYEIKIEGQYDWHPHLPIDQPVIQRNIWNSLNFEITHSKIRLFSKIYHDISIQPSDSNYLGKQYRSLQISKIVDFNLTALITISTTETDEEKLKSAIRQSLKINALCNLVKVKQFTVV